MSIDVRERAASLKVIDYWKTGGGNTTGKKTPRVLYDPTVHKPDGKSAVFTWDTLYGYILHGTTGADTLTWWLGGGSIANGTYTLAHFLAMRDRNTVAKMVPPGDWSCNHCGDSDWHDPILTQNLNRVFRGIECEDRQNWGRGANAERITDDQVIKCALIIAYDFALDHQQNGASARSEDRLILPHSQIAKPWGRRSDPEAGLFNYDLFYHVLNEIRKAANWPAGWPTRWTGNSPDV